jgi:hypothetical protein
MAPKMIYNILLLPLVILEDAILDDDGFFVIGEKVTEIVAELRIPDGYPALNLYITLVTFFSYPPLARLQW